LSGRSANGRAPRSEPAPAHGVRGTCVRPGNGETTAHDQTTPKGQPTTNAHLTAQPTPNGKAGTTSHAPASGDGAVPRDRLQNTHAATLRRRGEELLAAYLPSPLVAELEQRGVIAVEARHELAAS
jgi:hypothetical protein